MSKQKVATQSQTLFQDEESVYFEKLEQLSEPLRHCAREMVAFIKHLDHQTPALKILKQSYRQIESLPIKELHIGLETLKINLANVEFIKEGPIPDVSNQPDFISFFEIQNHFNAEMNALVQHAILRAVIK